MGKRKQPIVLLTRHGSRWFQHSEHKTMDAAHAEWAATIQGKGVTAWSWWGPRRIAEKMLTDPSYDPNSEAVNV